MSVSVTDFFIVTGVGAKKTLSGILHVTKIPDSVFLCLASKLSGELFVTVL